MRIVALERKLRAHAKPTPCATCSIPCVGKRCRACDADDRRLKGPKLRDRILRDVRIEASGCWIWTGEINRTGYGTLRLRDEQKRDRHHLVHRLMYQLSVGPIPAALVIDHTCRVRSCVNPEHLELVTVKENVLRGEGPSAVHARKTTCPRGHAYDGTTSARGGRGIRRYCKTCNREQQRARYRARRSA